jgi:hypothetical protein
MNAQSVDLKFDSLVFKETFDHIVFKGKPHSSVDHAIFQDSFIDFIKDLGLKIGWLEMFYLPPTPNQHYGIHTDVTGGDYVKVNWIFGGKNSLMKWYAVKPEVKKTPIKTVINSTYISYNKDEVDLINACSVGFPSIVQVGIPHNIYNPDEDRYCLSTVFRDTAGNRLTMSNATRLFEKYII